MYQHEKQLASARSMLQDTVRDHPQYLEAYDQLAGVLSMQGLGQEQLAVLERATGISPNSAARQTALGTAALQQGQRDVAARAFTRSMKLSEHGAVEQIEPFLGMARLHTESGNPAEAQQVLATLTQRYDSRKAQVLAKAETVRALQAAGDSAGAAKLAAELAALAEDGAEPLSSEMALRIASTLIEADQPDGATHLLQYVTRNNYDDEALLLRTQEVFDKLGMSGASGELVAAAKRQATEAMKDGVRLLSQGQVGAALDSLRGAKLSMPQNARVLLNFAAVALTSMERQGRSAMLENEVRASIATAQALKPGEPRITELHKQMARLGMPIN